MSSVLLIDNYDSFTYNLAHYIESLDVDVYVCRNDELNKDCNDYDHIIITPGPGLPKDAGDMMKIIESSEGITPVLGVCLGMQGICEYLGGELYNLEQVKHGVSEEINHDDSVLFTGISGKLNVGLYHSWAVGNSIGDFEVTAVSKERVVMAIQNTFKKMYGVQFHPESIMTEQGLSILKNFLNIR